MITRSGSSFAALVLLIGACASAPEPAARAFASDHISVTTRGSGPDVVLIHGLAAHADLWGATADALDDRYRLHVVQIRGFGGVPRASDDTLVAAPVAREIARYIRETGLTRPALVGHSMGGTIAMMTAARNPGVVGRVMVVDMVPFMGVMFDVEDAEALRPIAAQTREQILTTDMLVGMIGGMARDEADRARLAHYAAASDRRTAANAMHELIVTDMRPELARIDVPLTVLYAQGDLPAPPEEFDAATRELFANARNVTLVRIEDTNHYIQLDRPARFIAEVDAFMQR